MADHAYKLPLGYAQIDVAYCLEWTSARLENLAYRLKIQELLQT